MPMIEKPMNPNAEEDFRKAIAEAVEKIKYNFNEFPKDGSKVIPKLIWDMPTEYSGAIKLPYSPTGAWNDVFNILAVSGYRITATVEPPTETERKLDGVEPYIVIEYEEVE